MFAFGLREIPARVSIYEISFSRTPRREFLRKENFFRSTLQGLPIDFGPLLCRCFDDIYRNNEDGLPSSDFEVPKDPRRTTKRSRAFAGEIYSAGRAEWIETLTDLYLADC